MLGAILGDIIGSPYEFDQGERITTYPLFCKESNFTDDTVLTIAIAEALLEAGKDASLATIENLCIQKMQYWGRKYPDAGYGARFIYWLYDNDPKPYNSLGNGSAMRVSAVGWLYDTLERTLEVAASSAKVSHNHEEGIKGAKAVAGAIFLARTNHNKQEIKQFIEKLGYVLDKDVAYYQQYNIHNETCMNAIPVAMSAFLEGNSFEQVVRYAVSMGGDCDTITDIAGAIAEAYYGIDDALIQALNSYLPSNMKDVIIRFMNQRISR